MASMGGISLFKQGWKWVQSRKQALVFVRVAASWAGEKLVLLIDRHWPLVYSWCTVAGRFLFRLILQWRDCFVGGLRSLFTLGSAALFLILWSCFLCLTSMTSLFYMLLSLMCCSLKIMCVYIQTFDCVILQGGVEYRSEESRRIECTKCGNSHIWICTNRSKGRARWCQSCSQYHQAKDGDGWVESRCSPVITTPRKVFFMIKRILTFFFSFSLLLLNDNFLLDSSLK
ncbi:hypothetical protein GW17_00038377 [Ensete ventricosum]|uniref:Uncharacterized protein n=1 Tax=Ensete ventricosum TaxID=4639 RepID=A0A426XVQ4_ENSVE|nr:hypothetical protein B296_00056289 [Ensete ventricosum]RWV98757.1 hypothetical protein GW17_00038377 [Ensete ventricosum]